MRRTLGVAVCAALLSAALVGCDDNESPDRKGDGDRATGGLAKVAWTLDDGVAVGQVIDAGDGLGVYHAVLDGERLELRAVDLLSGEVRWSVETATDDGLPLEPVVDDGRVLFLAAEGRAGADPVPAVVDVAGGEVTKGRTPITSTSSPVVESCGTGVPSYCIWGSSAQHTTATKLWIHGSDLRIDDYWKSHPREASSGDGIRFDDDAREVLFRADGKVVWRKPWDRFFAGIDTSRGWSYAPIEEGTLLISVARDDAGDPLPAARAGTLAVDLATGRRQWLKLGVRPGSVQRPGGAFGARQEGSGDITLLCRYHGTFTSVTDPGPAPITAVEGVDKVTGKTRWTLPATAAPDCSLHSDDGRRAAITSNGAQWLDIVTGELTPRADDEIYWMPSTREVAVAGHQVRQRDVFEPVVGGGLSAEPTWPLPEGLGVDAGRTRAVVVGGELRGYRAP